MAGPPFGVAVPIAYAFMGYSLGTLSAAAPVPNPAEVALALPDRSHILPSAPPPVHQRCRWRGFPLFRLLLHSPRGRLGAGQLFRGVDEEGEPHVNQR